MDVNLKRNSDYNVNPSEVDYYGVATLLRVYGKIYKARCFDLEIVKAIERNLVIAPVYLSLGQEAVAAALSEHIEGFLIFTQHRAHDLYISIGADLIELRDELLGLSTGFSGGRAGSSCLRYMKKGIRLIGHHGLIGENVPQAVGAALASGEKTICLFGDGAAEEDYVLSSIGYAVTHKLPVIFICMDNDLSILTKTMKRRSWEIANVARGFGMEAYDLSDCPWTIMQLLNVWNGMQPLLINCRVCRERWHSGIGIDGEREWKRNEIVRTQLIERGLVQQVMNLEHNLYEEVHQLWEK